MASSTLVSSLILLTLASSCLLLLQPHPSSANSLNPCHFDKIYNFGDSLADTGNLIRQKPVGANSAFAKLPYGETFFKHPTGRCSSSNGRLIIDFIANASGLPFLNPYLKKDGDFRHGVNFAVAGATAVSTKVLLKMKVLDTLTNSSLHVQLDWMSKYFNSACIKERDCLAKQKTALFILGEIGNNDYNFPLFEGKTIQDMKFLVPKVIATITSAVRRVITDYRAVRVVVPGIFPIGCSPVYLTLFKTNDSSAYDKHRCFKELNSFAFHHNKMLQEAIQELKNEYPDVVIAYADYYHAFQWLFDHAVVLGFDGESTRKACCGIGGDYNFNFTRMCSSETPVCPNPDRFISWDGIHLTQRAYMWLTGWLIEDTLPKLQCSV